jgi:arylsulfatase
VWELFDTRADFSLANDLAKQNPAKLKELQALFLSEAVSTTCCLWMTERWSG